MASLVEQLYDPLLRYHQKDGKDFTDSAAASADAIKLGGEIAIRPEIKKILKEFEGAKGNTTRLSDAIIERWKTDKTGTFLKDLDADLARNPSLAKEITRLAKENPNSVADRLSQYAPGKLAVFIPNTPSETAQPVKVKTGSDDSPKETGQTSKTSAPKRNSAKPAPQNDDQLMEAIEQGKRIQSEAQAKQEAAGRSKQSNDIARGIFESLADRSDQEISSALDAEIVGNIATGLAEDATTKYGVPEATASAFKKKINDPKAPELLNAITKNLQNNPEFVRQLARMSKDNSPMNPAVKSLAQQEMNKLMANPDLLADPKYVQRMQEQMKTAEAVKNMDFNSLFAGIMGPLRAVMAQIGEIFSGFTGRHSVLSMSKGSSMFPNVLINLDNLERNKWEAKAFAQYSPRDLTAFSPKGADGKYYHDGPPITGPDGKQLVDEKTGKPRFEQVPNGQITVKDVTGKDIKVIPAVGSLIAKQEKGHYDNGVFVPGNIRVPVVTATNQDGDSSKIAMVVMTPAEFEKYKKIADAAARENNHSRGELPFKPYTEKDAREAGMGPAVTVVRVDPATGTAAPPTQVRLDETPAPGAQSFPVKPPGPIETRELVAN